MNKVYILIEQYIPDGNSDYREIKHTFTDKKLAENTLKVYSNNFSSDTLHNSEYVLEEMEVCNNEAKNYYIVSIKSNGALNYRKTCTIFPKDSSPKDERVGKYGQTCVSEISLEDAEKRAREIVAKRLKDK